MLDFHVNNMELSFTSDLTESKKALGFVNVTDNPQLNFCKFNNFFTFNDDITKRQLLGGKQSFLEVQKLGKFIYGTFAYVSNPRPVLNA